MGSSGVTVSKGGRSVSGVSGGNTGVVVGVGDDGSGNGLLDNGLSDNGVGVGDVVGFVNMDGGGDLNNLLPHNGDIIGDLNTPLDIHGLVDGVDLGLGLNDGGVDGLGSLKDGGDLDGEIGGGGLVDGGVVSGHVGGLAIVDLLGDNGGGLVDGGHTLGLGLGAVGGGDRDGGGSDRNGGSDCNGGGSISQMGGSSSVSKMGRSYGISGGTGISKDVGGGGEGTPEDKG